MGPQQQTPVIKFQLACEELHSVTLQLLQAKEDAKRRLSLLKSQQEMLALQAHQLKQEAMAWIEEQKKAAEALPEAVTLAPIDDPTSINKALKASKETNNAPAR